MFQRCNIKKVYHTISDTFTRCIRVALDICFGTNTTIDEMLSMSVEEVWSTLPHCAPQDPWIQALFSYKNTRVKNIIWEVKYKQNRACIALCGVFLHNAVMQKVKNGMHMPVLVSVPLHRARLAERGFDQNALLARAIYDTHISQHSTSQIQYTPNVLKKIRETLPQSSLKHRHDRLQNLRGVFYVQAPAAIQGRNVVLVDDVMTTGATLSECRACLLAAGARTVFCITVAH